MKAMKKVTLKKILTDRYKDFCIGHCVYVDGIIVYAGEEENPKPVPLAGFDYVIHETDTLADFINSLPKGKPVEKPRVRAMARMAPKKIIRDTPPCNIDEQQK